jgi:hypothetical protein
VVSESTTRIISVDEIIRSVIRAHPLSRRTGKDTASFAAYEKSLGITIASIAAAAYPETVTVQLTNAPRTWFEQLPHGRSWESKLKLRAGARGAERYLHPNYASVVRAECFVLQQLQQTFHIKNIRIGLPYCRSPFELERVLALLEKHGIARSQGWRFSLQTDFVGHGLLATSMAHMVDTLIFDMDTFVPGIVGERVTTVTADIQKTVEMALSDIVRSAHRAKATVMVSGNVLHRQPKILFSGIKSGVAGVITSADHMSQIRAGVIEAETTVGSTGYNTNHRSLALLAGCAVLGIALISTGAGCGIQSRATATPEMTPAQIRAEIAAGFAAERAKDDLVGVNTQVSMTIADFSINYPRSWFARYNPNKFIISSADGTDSITIVKHTERYSVNESDMTSTTIGGYPAIMFVDPASPTSTPRYIYEIELPQKKILEIQSTSSTARTAIIDSLRFTGIQ